jgi:hypothetical protein
MGPGLTGDRNFQNSCDVYVICAPLRRTVYGVSREELLHLANHAFLARLLEVPSISAVGWESIVVTKTKRIRMGLGVGWTRGARRRNEYGDVE